MKWLIYPTEQEAVDRSREGFVIDTATKRGIERAAAQQAITALVTKYRWNWNVGHDGQTALVIDGDEQLLTAEEQALLIDDLPDDQEGDNWYKPPPEMPPPPVQQKSGKRR